MILAFEVYSWPALPVIVLVVSLLRFIEYRHPDFKKLSPRRITSSPVAHADVALICELDEQWSFIGSKVRQHWLWYAYNTKTGGVLAYTFGPRTDATCRELLALLTPFNIGMLTTDE